MIIPFHVGFFLAHLINSLMIPTIRATTAMMANMPKTSSIVLGILVGKQSFQSLDILVFNGIVNLAFTR